MIPRLVSVLILALFIALVIPVQAAMPVATENDLAPFTGIMPAGVPDFHNGSSQSVLEFFSPFLAVVVLGFVLIVRREKRKEAKHPLWFWLAMSSGLFYLGSSAIIFVQMVRLISIAGLSPLVPITLAYAMVPAILGVWAMRLARSPEPASVWTRLFLGLIALLGVLLWSGLFIGPLMALCAAIVPERWGVPGLPLLPKK